MWTACCTDGLIHEVPTAMAAHTSSNGWTASNRLTEEAAVDEAEEGSEEGEGWAGWDAWSM